ncbi:MAG: sigma factor-like helix-turn-helix DNA-binding protein [bacterium]|nr:sigma factor-like helix-turn-helix DNA-binding protein [bacterium]
MPTAVKTTNRIIEDLFANLDVRQKKVLTKRYGLDAGEQMTLAELGKSFGVTRERIRQIEALALNDVRKNAKDGHLNELTAAVVELLKKTGGVLKEDHLLNEIKHFAHEADVAANFANQVRFLLEISKAVVYHREDETLHGHWHLSLTHQKKALDFLDALIKHLKDKKQETLHEKKFDEFFREVVELHKLEKEVAHHYMAISKKFGANLYGDFGLTEWPEVKPRVSRDWIYLILKKAGKPLHFGEIANEIRRLRSHKKTNTQTIHNELIKDKRFILVGRGIYGLREADTMPSGTIRDILIHILKTSGPLKPKDLIAKVLEHRIFKENTILFNLQNKKYFERLPDGKYKAR